MRRILVENARRKRTEKQGGHLARHELEDVDIATPGPSEDILAIDEDLAKLEAEEPVKAQLVKLRYFDGLAEDEAASVLGMSRTSAQRHWRYAKAWLIAELRKAGELEGDS
jgi:RNA polymerase sigma factor (TIGR02999 family)